MKRYGVIFLMLVFILAGCTPKVDVDPADTSETLDEKEDTENNSMDENNKESEQEKTSKSNSLELGIKEDPYPQDLKKFFRLKELPKYDPEALYIWQVDLRSGDISSWNLEGRIDDLMYAQFNSQTVWPENLPEGFDPVAIMELGKNPGLGIRQLHKQGITGKGVKVAIIDYALLVNHVEYKDNLRMYEHIHHPSGAHLHGPAVASILTGKTTGIAPEADLYFIACENFDFKAGKMISNFKYTAQAIERILEINTQLPESEKIKIISISEGWSENSENGYEEVVKVVEKAREEGVFIVSGSLYEYNSQFHFYGLDREPLADPDDFSSYKAFSWEKWLSFISHLDNQDEVYREKFSKIQDKKILMIPIYSRTTASATGEEEYVFYREGGWSLGIPYLAGMYTLALQVKPDITPEEFWNIAYETGESNELEIEGNTYDARIVNPVVLIEKLQQ